MACKYDIILGLMMTRQVLLKVVIGDRYSFAVEHEAPSMLYVFSGNLAILAWKSGNMLIKVGHTGVNLVTSCVLGDQIYH